MSSNREIADSYFAAGAKMLEQAVSLINVSKDLYGVGNERAAFERAQALSVVAQGHFSAAMAATTVSTQRDLLTIAAGQTNPPEAQQQTESGTGHD